MPRGNPLGYFGSVINTASTRYLDDTGSLAFAGRRKMGPIGERVRNFLMQGQRGGLRSRGLQTARRVMEFRGRGLARAGDMPQGAFTTSESFKRGAHAAAGGALNPQVGGVAGNPRGLIIGDFDSPVNPRMRINIDPANANNGLKYRIQGYDPRRGFATTYSGRGGTGGQFMANAASIQTLRNRNRRMMGYAGLATGMGVASAVTTSSTSAYNRTYAGPSAAMRREGVNPIQTSRGLGRNA